MPAAMEIGIVMTNASRASLPERNSAGKMIFVTALTALVRVPEVQREHPTDRREVLADQRAVGADLVVEPGHVVFEGERAEHPATRRCPAMTLTMRNTIVARIHNVTTADAKRRSTYRPMEPPSWV